MSRRQAQKRAEGPGARPFRGGFTTNIHGKADGCGDLIDFDLTGGQASDCTHFETLLDIGPDVTPRAAIADKGYSSKANRASRLQLMELRQQRIERCRVIR